MKYSVLIADDEPHARDFLEKLVKAQDMLELIGVCNSGKAVLEFCQTLEPDILLLDIQMPGLNGIETAKKLIQRNANTIIIFTTAFDQYAIDAFEVEAIGYLLKPFNQKMFSKTIDRAISQTEKKLKLTFNQNMQKLFERFKAEKTNYLKYFEIKDKGLVKRVVCEDIQFISADSEYVKLYTEKHFWLYRASLELLCQQLPTHFIRIHRSHVINLNHLQNWTYLNNGTYSFQFSNNRHLTSSRSYQKDIQVELEKLSSS